MTHVVGNISSTNKVYHGRIQCKSSAGLHSLKKFRFVCEVFQKCCVCNKRKLWPHTVLKCKECPYWCHKKCLKNANVEETPVNSRESAGQDKTLGDDVNDDGETADGLSDPECTAQHSEKIVTKTLKPQQLQMTIANVNNRMVMCIQFPGSSTRRHQADLSFESEKIDGVSIIRSSLKQVSRQEDLRSRSTIIDSRPTVTNGRRIASVLFILFRAVEDPFRLLNLFAHDTRKTYGSGVFGGVIRHVFRYTAASSRPVRPPRKRKLAITPSKDCRKSTVVEHDDDDDGLDYEILLFCRSPYRTKHPLRSSIPTWEL